MPFEVELTEAANQDYLALDARWRATVRSAFKHHLTNEPKKESKSRIKRLRGTRKPQYRLRVDDLRVFYDVSSSIVTVLAIVLKSRAGDWLDSNAEWIND